MVGGDVCFVTIVLLVYSSGAREVYPHRLRRDHRAEMTWGVTQGGRIGSASWRSGRRHAVVESKRCEDVLGRPNDAARVRTCMHLSPKAALEHTKTFLALSNRSIRYGRCCTNASCCHAAHLAFAERHCRTKIAAAWRRCTKTRSRPTTPYIARRIPSCLSPRFGTRPRPASIFASVE